MHEVGARLAADEPSARKLLLDAGLVRSDALLVLHIDGERLSMES